MLSLLPGLCNNRRYQYLTLHGLPDFSFDNLSSNVLLLSLFEASPLSQRKFCCKWIVFNTRDACMEFPFHKVAHRSESVSKR
ncbi:unnamed protein product [Lactuca virosa]|uniref:Uncharacterized protein n=1 Tax=Lactuca virosa TaxID=75947 RepID=A0AAU9MYH3_9ASTR|nr:unnamed protein product [Lactuca virosa]